MSITDDHPNFKERCEPIGENTSEQPLAIYLHIGSMLRQQLKYGLRGNDYGTATDSMRFVSMETFSNNDATCLSGEPLRHYLNSSISNITKLGLPSSVAFHCQLAISHSHERLAAFDDDMMILYLSNSSLMCM